MNGISDFQERRSFIFRSPFCRSPHEQWHHGGTSFELLLWTHNHSLGISTRREEVLDTFSAAPAVLGQQFLSPWHNEPPRGRCLGLSLYSRVFFVTPIYMIAEKASEVILAAAKEGST